MIQRAPALLLSSLLASLPGPPGAAGVPRAPQDPPGPQDPPAAEAPPEPVALVGATVHSMTPGAEPTLATVLVVGDRIEAVGAALELPEGTRAIDVGGLHLVPALADAAVHHDVEHDALYVAHGVTLVRDTGNRVSTILTERQRENRDRVPGPAILTAGQVLDGSAAATTDALVLASAGEAREKLRRLFALLEARAVESELPADAFHLDFLSFHTGIGAEAYREVLRLAHEELDLEVWGPIPAAVRLGDAIAAGQDGMLGLHGLLPPGKGWHEVSFEEVQEGVDALVASGLKVTPMLGVYARMVADRSDAQRTLAWLGPLYEQAWLGEAEMWDARRGEGGLEALTAHALEVQRRVVFELWERGVTLVPGSGAPNAWLLPGRSLLEELDQWVLAGIPREEVLRRATAGAAEALGLAGERGRIAPGQVADLVVMGTDPRRSLSGLADPEIVVVRGQPLERDEIFERLDATAEHQARARELLEVELTIEPPETPPGEVVLSGRAETRAHESRISAERFAVVETLDGRRAYCTRMVLPASMTSPELELRFTMWYLGDRLERFELDTEPLVPEELRERSLQLQVQGALVGTSSRMTVQRRSQLGFHDNRVADDPISLIDLSDALTALVAARHLREGVSFVLGFEGPTFEPVGDRWVLGVGDDGRVGVRTTRGAMVMGFGEDGRPLFLSRRVGSGRTELAVTGFEGTAPVEPARVFRGEPSGDPAVPEGEAENGGNDAGDDDGERRR